MDYYIKPSGVYVEYPEGNPVSGDFISVPQRPGDNYDWNGRKWIKSQREIEANKPIRAMMYKDGTDSIAIKAIMKFLGTSVDPEITTLVNEWKTKRAEIKLQFPEK